MGLLSRWWLSKQNAVWVMQVNAGPNAALFVEAGFVNQLRWDGRVLATSEPRPRLALNETRRAVSLLHG